MLNWTFPHIPTDRTKSKEIIMIDSDLAILALLLTVVLIAFLIPPGPGTPLNAPCPAKRS
jgi:hypothetical protein